MVVLLEPSVTVLPPVGAGWFRVTVQIVEMPIVRLSGLQTSEPTLGPLGVTVTVAVVLPPSVAVSVTVCEVVTVPAVGVNVVEVAAAGTVTDPVRAALWCCSNRVPPLRRRPGLPDST